MEVNREEALRALAIAQKHRSASNLPSALKFARKSVALFSTPEGEAMITIIEREIESGGSASGSGASSETSTANGNTPSAKGKASGIEEHVTSAHSRHGAKTEADDGKSKKREYTTKQLEVVKRVKACKHHQYYEILSVEKTCTENDVKKAYKKLALALHPDKNGAPGADEAFKMVSKAFQILSDSNLRAAYDSNPDYDPTQRNAGMPSRSGGMGGMGGMHPGFGGAYQQEINPEDLFNMFFGGGGGGFGNSPFGGANVFTFGGPGGFRTYQAGPRRPRQAADGDGNALTALLPILLVLVFSIITILPSILSTAGTPDPSYSFEPSTRLETGRESFNWKVPYFVNKQEWEKSEIWKSVPEARRGTGSEALYSSKVRQFEKGVEGHYVRRLQNECAMFNDRRGKLIADNSGFFGFGANAEKIAELRKMKNPACEQLRSWGVGQGQVW
ncbi:endoplasmic reticulum protein [Cryptococcus neoformans C23]|uniref:Endoplasmic reticulum protein n=2 Tax=Cryptococcus neoformans TaxID=5207 RepID=A0A854Q9S3_CRYNE|nr:endoplasmic reticulum protein [Cryptococcus neoformans var. grubii H99]AUB25758.1 endoplasmic reticulum protein [Cryptococcus neoformans var. grubii]OWZ42969.1 endoplasmic reticulum protein [Cryptococcus neoformans var. grubii C23]OXG19269.1 endoplasmic reticulum protein [Cryptococcus neoformans var. grubii Tu259-1]OXG80749.1 endoplasmic reticulum protein [Cryptococcus neoformans var. grubii Br795]OXG85687.1 endoplasmic reticulum protein [Cryptococcus neoformans var. grubii D17-1]OXG95115.|eukprot:XP_012050734.1 endoplasmic reticulum protein [Cryptococcus neoformans var. grubii H99]